MTGPHPYAKRAVARILKRTAAYGLLLPILVLLAPITIIGTEVYRLFQTLRSAR